MRALTLTVDTKLVIRGRDLDGPDSVTFVHYVPNTRPIRRSADHPTLHRMNENLMESARGAYLKGVTICDVDSEVAKLRGLLYGRQGT
jgi:hypothetical protein